MENVDNQMSPELLRDLGTMNNTTKYNTGQNKEYDSYLQTNDKRGGN